MPSDDNRGNFDSSLGNLYGGIAKAAANESIDELVSSGSFRLERIVSTGQATAAGEWYDQARDEWVVLLSGAAGLLFEDEERIREMLPGDFVNIAAHRRHRVEWTDADVPTVWLALRYRGDDN